MVQMEPQNDLLTRLNQLLQLCKAALHSQFDVDANHTRHIVLQIKQEILFYSVNKKLLSDCVIRKIAIQLEKQGIVQHAKSVSVREVSQKDSYFAILNTKHQKTFLRISNKYLSSK